MQLKTGMSIISSSYKTFYSKSPLPPRVESTANLNQKENLNKANVLHKKKRSHFSNPELINCINVKHTMKF